MNKALAIMNKYPNASPVDDFHVVDRLDGNGPQLDYWNVKDSTGALIPKPSDTDIQGWWIGALQQQKISELSRICNITILGGFSSSALGTSHNYQFDMEAQANLTGQLAMINADSTIASVNWKTTDSGVLSHTRAQFIQLCKDGFSFKDTKIQHFWDLKTQVLNATTEDQINAITW